MMLTGDKTQFAGSWIEQNGDILVFAEGKIDWHMMTQPLIFLKADGDNQMWLALLLEPAGDNLILGGDIPFVGPEGILIVGSGDTPIVGSGGSLIEGAGGTQIVGLGGSPFPGASLAAGNLA